MDTLGFQPRAFRMRSGCDATTPCALECILKFYAYLKNTQWILPERQPFRISGVVHREYWVVPAHLAGIFCDWRVIAELEFWPDNDASWCLEDPGTLPT